MSKADYIKIIALIVSAAVFLVSCGAGKEGSGRSNSELSSGDGFLSGIFGSESESARVTVSGDKFYVGGNEIFFSGMNAPWQNWNDFNGGMDEEFWETEFRRFKEDHINCVRIWVNCDGESIVDLNRDGSIASISEKHWEDLETLFDLAKKYKVYVMPTLLSFDHFKNGSGPYWRALIESKENCDEYAEKYVKEFCSRFGDNEYVFSVDLMNEPDWVYENEECGQIPWENISYLFAKCAATVHENSEILVTVGMGIVKYNSEDYEGDKVSDEYLQSLYDDPGAYLDFYSTHYYNWQRPWFQMPVGMTPEEFKLHTDKPCMIGETHNDDDGEIGMSLTDKYKDLYDHGWSGILVWSQTDGSEESWYHYDLTKAATNALYEYIPNKIYPLDNAKK